MKPPESPLRKPRTIDDAIAEATAARREAGITTDLERVLAIPREPPDDDAVEQAVAFWTARLGRPGAPPLRPGQALALDECAGARPPCGVAASLPVGEGKTLVAMLAAEAFALGGPRPLRPLVLVPAPLVKQWAAMVATWSRAYRFDPPACLSYGKLSTPTGEAAFREFAPDLIIFDEAHVLANLGSARTRRVVRWFVEHPDTRAVAMSGTLGSTTIRQFAHLLELCLREGAPVPLERTTLEQWAAVLDPKGEPAAEDWRAMWPLVRAFARHDPGPLRPGPFGKRREVVRGAFARRLASTPGFVTVKGSGVGASLRARTLRPSAPPSVVAALGALADGWTLPDGTELVDALEFDRHAASVAVGFYRRAVWPDGVVDDEWVEARRNWHAAVRNALEYSARTGFDSPALVEKAAEDGLVGDRLLRPYAAWCAVRHRPGPGSEVVWLDGARDWLKGEARAWCAGRASGILWWLSPAVGDALAEVPGVCGPFGAGSDQPDPGAGAFPEAGAFPVVSMRVHGTGWNAQPWCENLIVEVPSSADLFEQVIGRTHRPGQLAGAVRVDVLAHTWRARRALETALARAAFVVESRGEDQKLTLAQWEDG